jgi:hypothetical protein
MLRDATIVLALTVTVVSASEADGVRWERDLPSGLSRAAKEGRPILLAVNALETESANQALATRIYRSGAWGLASEDWVCFVGNPNPHGAVCSRYGDMPCETHQQVLRYILRRFAPSGELISPQHLILDSDGMLRWRKEYYTGVVGPKLLERYLPRLSPLLALDRASRTRVEKIDALGEAAVADVGELARTWLRSDDPLAAAGLMCAIDYALEEDRRAALIRAFDAVASDHVDVPWTVAYEVVVDPDTDPVLTEAWIEAMLGADRELGLDLAARAAVHSKDTRLRSRFQRHVAAPKTERGKRLRREMDALVRGKASGTVDTAANAEARRARYVHRKTGARLGDADLDELLGEDAPAAQARQALLWMSPAQVRKREVLVRRLLRERPEERVRVAAALAMLGAKLDEGGRVPLLLSKAVFDTVEGLETRAEAAARLGEDAGFNEASWLEALRRHVGGR